MGFERSMSVAKKNSLLDLINALSGTEKCYFKRSLTAADTPRTSIKLFDAIDRIVYNTLVLNLTKYLS